MINIEIGNKYKNMVIVLTNENKALKKELVMIQKNYAQAQEEILLYQQALMQSMDSGMTTVNRFGFNE